MHELNETRGWNTLKTHNSERLIYDVVKVQNNIICWSTHTIYLH